MSYSCAKEHTEGLRREVTDMCWGTDMTNVCWGTDHSTISNGDGSIGHGFQRTVETQVYAEEKGHFREKNEEMKE